MSYYNNKPCVEVIERKNGIFGYLDEECVFPKGTDASYLEKIVNNIKGHANFDKSGSKGCFLIKVSQPRSRLKVVIFLLFTSTMPEKSCTRLMASWTRTRIFCCLTSSVSLLRARASLSSDSLSGNK